jgi:phosphoribosylanthranilate isomerase
MRGRQGTEDRGQDGAGRTRVKICGLTNRDDAEEAARLGADFLGVIRVPNTPRYFTDLGWVKQIAALTEDTSGSVFAGKKLVRVIRDFIEMEYGEPREFFHHIQYYQDTRTWENSADAPFMIPAFPMRDAASLDAIDALIRYEKIQPSTTFALLLDAYHQDKLGGSGETFNWDLAVEAKRRFGLPIILAGGLTAENVGDAIARVRPFAVDVSSGVEAEPGRKDYAKLAAFFRAVREADALLRAE